MDPKEMIPKVISLGPLTIYTYGLIIGFAIALGWYLAKKRAHTYKIKEELFEGWSVFIPIVSAIVGARIYHVLDYWAAYKQNLLAILEVQNGGLGIWGGLFGGILGVLMFCRVNRVNFLKALDLAAPSMILGQAIGRVGNYINQEGFGPPSDLPWAVFIDTQNRPQEYILTTRFHPSFFYEGIFNVCIFIFLIVVAKRLKNPGQVFALYLTLYATLRFFIEFLRIDTWTVGTIKIAQVIALLVTVLGLSLFLKAKRLDPSTR